MSTPTSCAVVPNVLHAARIAWATAGGIGFACTVVVVVGASVVVVVACVVVVGATVVVVVGATVVVVVDVVVVVVGGGNLPTTYVDAETNVKSSSPLVDAHAAFQPARSRLVTRCTCNGWPLNGPF